MEHVELRIPVKASQESVWSAITDWKRQGEWMFATHVDVTSDNHEGVGASLAAFTGFGPVGFLDTMTITSWEPPYRCDVNHTGRVVRGTGTFIVERISDSESVFVWSEDLEIPLGSVGRLGFALTRPTFITGVRKSLEKFARLVEAGTL